MQRKINPLLEPLSWNDIQNVGRIVSILMMLLSAYVGWKWASGRPLMNVDATESNPVEFVLDVNKASWPEIAQLPGIGEVLAKRIVDYRDTHGPFQQIAELKKVHGVGERILEQSVPFLLPIRQTGSTESPIPRETKSAMNSPNSPSE